MIPRLLGPTLRALARKVPVVTVFGPRQSGKTMLCRAAFPRKPYANLEAPDVRQFALEDPRGFLRQFPAGALLDEVQRAPELLSYIQAEVDEHRTPGRYVLTGSQQWLLSERTGQSLAGRTGQLLNLSQVSSDAGVSHTTARQWLSLLEALKGFHHRGLAPRMHFYRDSNGNEVDLLLEHGAGLYAVEVKAGATIASDSFKGLAKFSALMKGRLSAGAVVYGGDRTQQRSGMQVAPALSCDLLFSRWLGKRRTGR